MNLFSDVTSLLNDIVFHDRRCVPNKKDEQVSKAQAKRAIRALRAAQRAEDESEKKRREHTPSP